VISLHALSFSYPGHRPIFDGFDWSVSPGEAWAILGPSGCGKSTLLYLLACVLSPTAGEILIEGQPITRPRPRTGLILQDYGLLPWATCAQNVSLGLRIHGFYGPDGKHAPADAARGQPGAIAARTDHWLHRLGLTHVRGQYPSQLSGGQRQRAAIARTLVLEPDVLLMDEPFAALDALTREDLERLTLELHAETGTTLIFVTHNIEEAVLLGQKILVLGPPPHRRPCVIENALAGGPLDGGAPEFQAQCRGLREMLGRHA